MATTFDGKHDGGVVVSVHPSDYKKVIRIPECPSCGGQAELSGLKNPKYGCHFCGKGFN